MALRGIRVVEFAGLAPAPFCGMVLADFGASVIRIDRKDTNADLDCLGNGKKSICVNLKSPQGINIVKALIKRADVSIEPFRAGVMESLGLGPDVLIKDNPKLIYARLTGYGQSGPLYKKAGHDINYLAISGLLSLFGRKNENPISPVNLAADFGGGGLMCALGIVMALFESERSGKGQIIDANMVQGVSYLGSFLYRSQNMPIWGRKRGENILDTGAPFYEVYKTKDKKYMAVGAIEGKFYKDLLRGLNLSVDEAPQFDFAVTKAIFERKFAEKTRDEWCEIFEKLDACVSPVLELDEAPEDAHNKYRETFSAYESGHAPNPAPLLDRTPARATARLERPKIGQHTVEVLTELGYNLEELIRFKSEGVVHFENQSKL